MKHLAKKNSNCTRNGGTFKENKALKRITQNTERGSEIPGFFFLVGYVEKSHDDLYKAPVKEETYGIQHTCWRCNAIAILLGICPPMDRMTPSGSSFTYMSITV